MTEQIKQRIEMINRGEVPEGYKKTKVGIVPREWEETTFSTIFTSTNDYTEDILTYPLYSLTIVDGITAKSERYERSHLVKKENAYKIVKPNDFAYNPMNIRFGAVARHKEAFPVSVSGYYDIFTTVNKSDLSFMDNYLVSENMITYYNKVSTGSLLEKQRVHFSQFIEFNLPLPSIEEREKIAEILTTQDKVIELKQKLINEKKQQKKWLMQQLLTGKIRLKGFSGEWKKVRLGEVLAEGSKKAVDNTAEYRKITIKLNFNGIEFTETKREMADTRPFYIRKKDEIIVGKQNYFNGSVAIITEEYDGCICSNAIMSFNVINGNLYYIYAYITQPDFMNKYFCLANGTGQKELSEKDFLNFIIKFPPLPEQTAIASILSTQDKEIELLEKDLEQEKLKKKALMQLLLTGKVRVK